MNDNELINTLRRLKVQTGSLACLGCGHEHSCSVRGCAIVRSAADLLEQQKNEIASLREINSGLRYNLQQTGKLDSAWINADEEKPADPEELVLCIVSGKTDGVPFKSALQIGLGGIIFKNALQIGLYDPNEGWIIEGWEAYRNLTVSYWMHQPKFPHEEMEDKP